MISQDRSILKSIVKHIQERSFDPITPLIDEYFTKRELPKYQRRRLKEFSFEVMERPRPKGRLSPSSICGCERQAALKFIGAKGQKRTNVDTELIFLDGHWRHHKWDYIFLDMEAMFPNKIRVLSYEEDVMVPELYIAGALDMHLQIKVDKQWLRFVLDFKGANNYAFDAVHREHKPKEEHVLQLLSYMRAKKCRRGAIIYDSKERNTFYVFVVEFNREKWQEVSTWCGHVLGQIEQRLLPPAHPSCDRGNFMGDKCVFRGLCYGPKDEDTIEEEIYKGIANPETLWQEGLTIASRNP